MRIFGHYVCARCKRQIPDGAPIGESAIYQSRHILCEPCFLVEDAEIDCRGTNNLPDTLKGYGIANDL